MTHTLTTLSDPNEILSDTSDVGGSAQFTDPVSARAIYSTDDADTPYFVRDFYAYGVARDESGNDLDNMDAEAADAADFRVEIQIFESYCTDYTDPGSSEVSADVKYETGFGKTFLIAPDKHELRATLQQYLAENLIAVEV